MTDNEPPTIANDRNAIHGFAHGDRVIATADHGVYGKVVYVNRGCADSCRQYCRLIWVETPDNTIRKFCVDELEHAD